LRFILQLIDIIDIYIAISFPFARLLLAVRQPVDPAIRQSALAASVHKKHRKISYLETASGKLTATV
jgi:hypothetical protein